MDITTALAAVHITGSAVATNWNEWAVDSGGIQLLISDVISFEGYNIANPGTKVELAGFSFLEGKGHDRLQLLVKQPDGVETAAL